MSNYFQNFNPRIKLAVIVLSVFLVSLVLGMLVFGNDAMTAGQLTAETLKLGSEAIHFTP